MMGTSGSATRKAIRRPTISKPSHDTAARAADRDWRSRSRGVTSRPGASMYPHVGYLRPERPMNDVNGDANQADAWLDLESVDGARVVSFHGEHDISTVDLVRERLRDAAVGEGVIIIDLADATFIDSSVAGALLEAYRRETPPRMRFVVAPGTPPRDLFTILGFDGAV